MPKGDPDPRTHARPLLDLAHMVREGAEAYNSGRFWDAHEAWEGAWHTLRSAQKRPEAEFLQGLILIAAGCENLRRGKPTGFVRQYATGLVKLRASLAGADLLGIQDAPAWVESATDHYLEYVAAVKPDAGRAPPTLRLTS